MAKKLYIGCDDAGCALKRKIIAHLEKRGCAYEDCGSEELPVRYPYYAAAVAAAVSRGEADRGILVCGSGVGISIAANKYPGVRAALCTSVTMARLTRGHNDSNILCLGGRLLGEWEAIDIVDAWLDTPYDGGHHQPSLDLIAEMERAMYNGTLWEKEPPVSDFRWPEEA